MAGCALARSCIWGGHSSVWLRPFHQGAQSAQTSAGRTPIKPLQLLGEAGNGRNPRAPGAGYGGMAGLCWKTEGKDGRKRAGPQLGGLGSGLQWNPGNKNQGRKGRELGLVTGFLGIFNIQACFKGVGSSLCSLSLMGRKSRIKHILQFASKIIPG